MWQKNKIFDVNLSNKMTYEENRKIDENPAFFAIDLS